MPATPSFTVEEITTLQVALNAAIEEATKKGINIPLDTMLSRLFDAAANGEREWRASADPRTLAMMLGVRRPGVTVAIQQLEREGVIARTRGRIAITNRKALEKRSNGTYLPADYR